MPRVFEWKGWRFEFYSLDRHEPAHIHVRKDRKETKIWLQSITVARNKRCSQKELNDLLAVVGANQKLFMEKWDEHFGD